MKSRNAMLAKIHIAVKDLGISEEDYRDILEAEFGVRSASKLMERDLDRLIARFRACGWKPKKSRPGRSQAEALRERAREIAVNFHDGEKRLTRLSVRICGVEKLEWCNEAGKLKRLLAALEKIRNREALK